jgi:Helicase conserved C-terminal domain
MIIKPDYVQFMCTSLIFVCGCFVLLLFLQTNAAESSVTLPSVDHVICLGLCRQITYNQASHRQMLTPTWISKASATQRAGRTGRVRPGSVYRLYTRNAYEHYMEEFEPGEMVRIPLDSVILMLKQILHEEVKPIFLDCLEPPKLDTIDRSFQSLYKWNFLTDATDQADITSLGSFVSSLGVDLSLGSFIGMGIQFGVAAEAIEMAAMMALPKTPFQIASPLWLSTKKFNDIAPKIYISKSSLDGGLYSEPMALMNAIWDYIATSKKSSWYHKNRFAAKRWQQVVSSRNSLRNRVANFLGIDETKLQVQLPPRDMPPAKVAILRILCVWVFSDSIAECAPSKLEVNHDGSVAVTIKSSSTQKLDEKYLKQILDVDRHPHTLLESNLIEQNGTFECAHGFRLLNTIEEFEKRIISYMCEKQIPAAFVWSNESSFLYLDTERTLNNLIVAFVANFGDALDSVSRIAYIYSETKRRGLQERACGMWTIQNDDHTRGAISDKRVFQRFSIEKCTHPDFGLVSVRILHELYASNLKSTMIWYFPAPTKKKSKQQQQFELTLRGECLQLTKTDLNDMLGCAPTFVSTQTKATSQAIVFHKSPSASEGQNALLKQDVPEGVRVIATMACSQRKGAPRLRFPDPNRNLDDQESDKNAEETIDFPVSPEQVDVARRWRRMGTDGMVYVEDSVPASAIHPTSKLFAVASNALELQRGGLRVECLTLLPPNPLFLLLSLLTFGLDPVTSFASTFINPIENEEDKTARLILRAMCWLEMNAKVSVATGLPSCHDEMILTESPGDKIVLKRAVIKERLEDAIKFNATAMNMGEKLMCFPDQIKSLCEIFDGLDDHLPIRVWDTLHDESLTDSNLMAWRQEYKTSRKKHRHSTKKIHDDVDVETDHLSIEPNHSTKSSIDNKTKSPASGSDDNTRAKSSSKSNAANIDRRALRKASTSKPGRDEGRCPRSLHCQDFHALRTFDDRIIQESNRWFATTLNGFEMPVFPSTNILALVFDAFGKFFLDSNIKVELDAAPRSQKQNEFLVSLYSTNWDIISIKQDVDDLDGSITLYKAHFINPSIPDIPVFGRGKNKLPKWLKKGKGRPSKIDDAKACVPPAINFPDEVVEVEGHGLAFKSLYGAVQMESAFWLEKQFCYAGKTCTRHWYDHTMDQMLDILVKQTNVQEQPLSES